MRNYEQVQPYDDDHVRQVMSKLGLHVANRSSRMLSKWKQITSLFTRNEVEVGQNLFEQGGYLNDGS
jgi:hypothetical protein